MSDATGRRILDFDGLADFYVHKYEDFENAFKDPEYLQKVNPDESKFVDMDSLVVTIGYDHIVIENGDIVLSHKQESQ